MSRSDLENEISDSKSEILFNVKQCEELFQKDKSEKLKQDIETFKANIKSAKEAEIQFYKNLLLESKEKERIFGFRGYEKKEEPKVIVWDPLEGNLIISEQEYKAQYQYPKQRGSVRQSVQQNHDLFNNEM